MKERIEIKENQFISLPFIDDKRLRYDDKNGEFSILFAFLHERVIFIKSVGTVNSEYAENSNAIMKYIEDSFLSKKKKISFYFINDSTEINQYHPIASRLLRMNFESRLKLGWFHHVAIVSHDPLIKLYIKTTNFLRKKKVNSGFSKFKDAAKHIQKLIESEETEIVETPKTNGSKESSEEKIKRLEEENAYLKKELHSTIDHIAHKIETISVEKSLEPITFKDQENSLFNPIYNAINFLKLEVQLIVRNLNEANSRLEENVKDRSSEIVTNEMRLQSLMTKSNDFICLLKPDLKLEYINPALKNYLKSLYNVEVKIGDLVHNVLPEEVVLLTQELLNEAKEGSDARKQISARKIHIDFTATVIMVNNEIDNYLLIGRNISELSVTLEKLKKSKDRYQFITENLNDVIWTHNENKSINFVSPSILRQRGFTPEEYKSMTIEEQMTMDSAVEMRKIINNNEYLNYSKENPLVFTGKYLRKDGSIMYGESYGYPVYEEGKMKSILGITRDVSERIEYLNLIKHQKSELETILNNTDEQIISVNRNFEYVTLNDVAIKYVRKTYNREPKIGDSILENMSAANKSKIQVAFAKVLKGEEFNYIFRIPKNGKLEYNDARFRPIFLNNEVFGISMFVKNITENINIQIALEEHQRRLKRITETALEGVWEYSFTNNDLYLSSRLKQLISYKGENDLTQFKKHLTSILNPQDYEKILKSIDTKLALATNFEITERIKLRGENEKWLLARAFISYDQKNNPTMVSGVLIDVTKQKEQEKALQKAKNRAEELVELKTNFLANMSHEVRTPLNGILGVTQLLEQEGLPENINYYLQLQRQSGLRLLDTINNILSISRLDASKGRAETSSVGLNKFIENNLGPFEIVAKQKGLELVFESDIEEVYVAVNEHLFFQVINNLLGNAIKFTHKGKVCIKTSSNKDTASLIVEDTGIGISKEFLERIFEAFEQESTGINRNFEGSGLGLAIVKRYIDLIGGDIKVNSVKNKGTQFILILPLSMEVINT